MIKAIRNFYVVLIISLIAGCQGGLSSLYSGGFPGTASWSILPIVNFSQAEGVSPQIERTLVVLLPSIGIDNPVLYPDMPVSTSSDRLAEAERLGNSKDWASTQGAGFAIGGQVQDWFIDSDGRAQVALSLYVTDARTGETLWSVSGASEGMAGESIHQVSRALITDLLQSLPVMRRQ